MKIRIITAALAALFMLPLCGTVAYAGGGDYIPIEAPAETQPPAPVETPEPVIPATEGPVTPEAEPKPFTPDGTGTVIDHATDGDGKEFYTIMTPAEHVFYLVIDRQREQQNVYFLNAVTEADLLALAEMPPAPDPAPVEPTPAPIEPEPEQPAPEPEKGGGMGMMIFVILVVLAGGGAGYYFKIYRPKQQQADAGDELDYIDESDPHGEDTPYPGDGDAPEQYDGPPWYENEDERGGGDDE